MKKIHYYLIPLVLSGCAVGPDFVTPESPKVERYSSEILAVADSDEHPALITSDTIPAQWWQLFRSEELTQLVEAGLANSPTLVAARAKLKASQETLSADTASLLFPAIDASANSSRQKISGATFGNAGNPSIFSVHNASVDVSYSVDAFGGGRRYLEYGRAGVDYDAFQLEASKLTLTTNIVTAAFAEASLREQVAAMESIITDESETLELVEKQFAIGVVPKVDLLSQRASLAQARTQLPALQKALIQTRHQLATLTGKLPSEARLPQISLGALEMPREIPLTLPSTLTRRRPDVRAAEAQLHQASAQVGIAKANLYPKLSLSGSYATEATRISDLFSAGSAVWGLAAGLTQPIFRAGELHARKRAALAGFDQAAALYRQSVLVAFQDVADALLAIEMDSRQLTLEKEAERLSSETLEVVREQYRQGAVSYLSLLDARRRYQQARISLIKARVALYNDTAALMYALGGGWWESAESDIAKNDGE